MNNKQAIKLTGIVERVSDQTARVKVSRIKRHPIYSKQFTVHKTYFAVIPADFEVKEGDTVQIIARSKVSKTKCWQLVK